MEMRSPLTFGPSTGGDIADSGILAIQSHSHLQFVPGSAPDFNQLFQRAERGGKLPEKSTKSGNRPGLSPDMLKRLTSVQIAVLLIFSGALSCGEIQQGNDNSPSEDPSFASSTLTPSGNIEAVRDQLSKIGLDNNNGNAIQESDPQIEELLALLNPGFLSLGRIPDDPNAPWLLTGTPGTDAPEIQIDIEYDGVPAENHVISEGQSPFKIEIQPKGSVRPTINIGMDGLDIYKW